MNYWKKKELYRRVDNLIKQLDLNYDDYPLDSIELAKKFCVNLNLVQIPFDNLCGVMYRGKNNTSIALNSGHSSQAQNFDCMHELIHYFLHDSGNTFNCFEQEDKSRYLKSPQEWQANEGAAQALVPYQTFIPMYVNLCLKYPRDKFMFEIEKELAEYFFVTDYVIHNRIKSLQYEIYQYFDLKTPISNVILKSNSQLIKEGLTHLDAHKSYCFNCLSAVNKENFCTICGNNLTGFRGKMKGLGYMKYAGIETYDSGKAKECAVCHNDETDIKGDYCQICGTYLLNQCASAISNIPFTGEEECTHTEILPSNARYCPYCGNKTTFLENGLLKDWNYCDDDYDDIPDELPFF